MKVYILQLVSGYQTESDVINVYDDLAKVFNTIYLMTSSDDFIGRYMELHVTQNSNISWLVKPDKHENVYLVTQKEIQ